MIEYDIYECPDYKGGQPDGKHLHALVQDKRGSLVIVPIGWLGNPTTPKKIAYALDHVAWATASPERCTKLAGTLVVVEDL